jgi:hypothetical protein
VAWAAGIACETGARCAPPYCGAKPDDLDVETKANVLGQMASASRAVLVLEVAQGNIDVSVRRKGPKR